ncbi:LOW QUALITY PROTEIN: hypothetical protein OSB04_024844 [Centaurea solstitialis]|uniref:Uncharacterized protein n=1 Tax=Centaurea solstitialis TaxID=347529 RepID=A0AA38W129_9ASTR|nr:LOW QUALITY PROTEIN: hypothetical protein OSB04_024844 [Centaurea solstitialis]
MLSRTTHDLVNERSRFAKDREEYVQEIFELQRTVADLQKLLEDKAGQEKQNVELEVAKERHVFETEIEKLTKTVSDLQNTLLEERKVFDLTSVNLSKKISELERKIILDKKNSLKKPSLRAGKYQNIMHEFEEEIQGVHSVRKVDDKKCIELQKQIVDLQNQLSDVRHQFKQKEKVLRHEKTVLEQIIAEPKKPTLVEADFEDQKEAFKAEIRKLTSKLSELSTNIMNEQRMRSDQQKKLNDLLEERNKLSSKVKDLEKTTFKAHNSSNVASASLSNINSSGQIRTSNLFYDRRVDYSGNHRFSNSKFIWQVKGSSTKDIEVSMISPEPEDLPKKHIPRLDLVCEGVNEMNIETRHGSSVDNSCHPTKLLKYLLKDVCFNSHGELAYHLSNLHSEDLDIETRKTSSPVSELHILCTRVIDFQILLIIMRGRSFIKDICEDNEGVGCEEVTNDGLFNTRDDIVKEMMKVSRFKETAPIPNHQVANPQPKPVLDLEDHYTIVSDDDEPPNSHHRIAEPKTVHDPNIEYDLKVFLDEGDDPSGFIPKNPKSVVVKPEKPTELRAPISEKSNPKGEKCDGTDKGKSVKPHAPKGLQKKHSKSNDARNSVKPIKSLDFHSSTFEVGETSQLQPNQSFNSPKPKFSKTSSGKGGKSIPTKPSSNSHRAFHADARRKDGGQNVKPPRKDHHERNNHFSVFPKQHSPSRPGCAPPSVGKNSNISVNCNRNLNDAFNTFCNDMCFMFDNFLRYGVSNSFYAPQSNVKSRKRRGRKRGKVKSSSSVKSPSPMKKFEKETSPTVLSVSNPKEPIWQWVPKQA